MASYTQNYALKKPTLAEVVNVNDLNGNADIIDNIMHSSQVSLADAYDLNEIYNTGDVVMYELLMYKCLEDEVTGAWDGTKWERTTASECGGGGTASEVSYDNSDSGMTATNVQEAVDELKEAIDDIPQTEVEVEASEEGQSIATISVNGDSTSINLPAIEGSGSGAVVTIEDALIKAISKLTFYIEPVQSGSGDPSPQNQRPISGWTGAEVARTGKNLCDDVLQIGSINSNTGEDVTSLNTIRIQNKQSVKAETIYMLNTHNLDEKIVAVHFYNGETFIRRDLTDGKPIYTFTTPQNCNGIRAIFRYNDERNLTNSDIPNFESIALYEGPTVFNFSWQSTAGTVYGGQLTVFEDGSGELEVTDAGVDLGELTWTLVSGATSLFTSEGIRGLVKVISNYGAFNGLCSIFPILSYNDINAQTNYGIAGNINGVLRAFDSSYTSADTFKASLAGQILVYELATPQTYTFPAGTFDTIETLKGINNIWSNTGDIVDLQYQKDLVTMLNMLWDAVFNGNSGTRTLASLNLTKGISEEEVKKVEETEEEQR